MKCLTGGSPKTATNRVSLCTRDIIAPTDMPMGGSEVSSLARDTTSSSAQLALTPFLFGEITSTTLSRGKTALNARSSATKHQSRHPSLSDRLTPSLITAGLVKGITPKSIRKQFGAVLLDGALSEPDGSDAEPRKTGNSSSNENGGRAI